MRREENDIKEILELIEAKKCIYHMCETVISLIETHYKTINNKDKFFKEKMRFVGNNYALFSSIMNNFRNCVYSEYKFINGDEEGDEEC